MGIFAKEFISKGDLIAVWGGVIYSKIELIKMSQEFPKMISHPFGVCKNFYMGPIHPDDPLDDAEIFNHSCDANAGIKGQIIVVAIKDIQPNEEIFFDYETVEIDSTALGFKCKCGATDCRKEINGSAWKNISFRKKYKGFFSTYIQDLIDQETSN